MEHTEKAQMGTEERRAALQAELDALNKERESKVARMSDFIDQVATAVAEKTKGLPKEEAEEKDITPDIGSLQDKINGLQDDIKSLTKEQVHVGGGGIGYDHAKASKTVEKDNPDGKRFNISRAVWDYLSGWQLKTEEQEMLSAFYKANFGETRTLQMGVSSGGGFLVPPQWLSDMIELLRPNLVLAQLGARFRPLPGPTSLRKMKSGATSYWVQEGRKATKSEPSYGRINLTPKPLVTMVPVSEDLLEMGVSGIQNDIEEDMGRSQAETLDLAALKGDGGEAEPMGVINLVGGTTEFGGGSPIDYLGPDQNVTDKLDDMAYSILARDVKGQVAFAISPQGIQKLRTSKDADGKPLFFDEMRDSRRAGAIVDGVETGVIHGRTYAATSALTYGTATTDLLAGVWREMMVSNFGATAVRPSFDASDPTDSTSAFMQREVWIRMVSKWDTAVRNAEAFQSAANWDTT